MHEISCYLKTILSPASFTQWIERHYCSSKIYFDFVKFGLFAENHSQNNEGMKITLKKLVLQSGITFYNVWLKSCENFGIQYVFCQKGTCQWLEVNESITDRIGLLCIE